MIIKADGNTLSTINCTKNYNNICSSHKLYGFKTLVWYFLSSVELTDPMSHVRLCKEKRSQDILQNISLCIKHNSK